MVDVLSVFDKLESLLKLDDDCKEILADVKVLRDRYKGLD